MNRLKKYLITGLLVIAPIFLTLWVLFIIFKFADSILGRFINTYIKAELGFNIPGIGVLLSLGIIILVGFFARFLVGKKIFPTFERWFCALPFVKNIYPAFKQLVSFMLAQKEFGFKRVVLVEYPSKGIWSLGFLTNDKHELISLECDKEMVPVFIPTTPGPFSGFVVFVPRQEVKFIKMPVTEALKIIISGGVFRDELNK